MKMKTLKFNGKTFDVNDDGAVRYDEAQNLTEGEKARARANTNAAAVGEGGGGGITVTDDGAGNVEITSSGSVSITDDGNGNVTIG